ncbi:hypothetical protein CK203_110843 [Vitis vinifera]|uniref:Reverse transcriptase domain-containing protein n=1 Tax=Vitis vinifera TaxID=29760 RepID=A0A438C9M2_VITVI|nr:hypothetical protein CK203_110843 [Vitis vinifera]
MIRGVEKSPCGLSAVRGPTLKERMTIPDGPEASQPKRWAHDGRGPMAKMEEARSSQFMAQNKGKRPMEKGSLLGYRIASNRSSLEGEHLVIWETEEARKKREKAILSATDKALAEEAMRYDSRLRIERERGYGSSHLILYSFDQTPEREPFDHSGVLRESNEGGPGMDGNGCWDLVEFNKDPNLARGVEWNSERTELQEETKIQLMSEGVVRSLGSGRFLDWRALDADGAAGGLLICWDKRSLEIVDWEEGQYSLSCRFKNVEDGVVWVFTGVYGPFTKEERECLWEELGAVRGIWDEPWAGRSPVARGVFTWSGGLNNQSWARLDRFLVSPSWLDQFSGVIQRRLPRPVSDHFPILLEGGGLRRGPSPFRFENMWLKVEGFLDLIRNWWKEIEVRGTASYRLAAKMKELKQKLKAWNREVFGNLEEEQEVREGIANAYQQRLSEDLGWKADIERIQLDQISQQEVESLEIPFSENEIHSALMEMSGDKAPGPNGFTMAFWQSCWDFVKGEILEMFKEFHEQSSFLKSLNNTFLVLIPKKGGSG